MILFGHGRNKYFSLIYWTFAQLPCLFTIPTILFMVLSVHVPTILFMIMFVNFKCEVYFDHLPQRIYNLQPLLSIFYFLHFFHIEIVHIYMCAC